MHQSKLSIMTRNLKMSIDAYVHVRLCVHINVSVYDFSAMIC